MDEQCDACIEILQRIGINFVGIDFDVSEEVDLNVTTTLTTLSYFYFFPQQTFISRHTGGRWPGDAHDLAVSSRQEFIHLVPKLIKSGECLWTMPAVNVT